MLHLILPTDNPTVPFVSARLSSVEEIFETIQSVHPQISKERVSQYFHRFQESSHRGVFDSFIMGSMSGYFLWDNQYQIREKCYQAIVRNDALSLAEKNCWDLWIKTYARQKFVILDLGKFR